MSKMKRREFLVGGATAVAGLTCLSGGLRAAVVAAQRSGKPLLTEGNLNSFIKANPLRVQKGQDVSAEAIRDLDGFVKNHFYLTDAQSRELASIPADDKSKLTEAIRDMREKKGSVTIHIVPGKGRGLRREHGSAPFLPKISIQTGHNDDLGWYITVTITKED